MAVRVRGPISPITGDPASPEGSHPHAHWLVLHDVLTQSEPASTNGMRLKGLVLLFSCLDKPVGT